MYFYSGAPFYFLIPVYPLPGTRYSVPGTPGYSVPGTWYLRTRYRILGTRYLVSSTRYQVLGSWYQEVLGTRYKIAGTWSSGSESSGSFSGFLEQTTHDLGKAKFLRDFPRSGARSGARE